MPTPVINWRTQLGRMARAAILAFLTVCLLMTFLETWLVYPIPPIEQSDWNPANLRHQEVTFDSGDGTRLSGWLLEHPNPQQVILYFHGNGELVADNGPLMALLRDRLNATVFIFDYRGYGKSEGKPYEAGIVADGIAAQRWLAKQAGVAPGEIVLIGRSLGGGVAIATAAELGAKALVLQSTFARMVDTAASHFPWLPVKLLMRNRWDSLARIENYHGPVLQSHGTADEVIAISEGKRLFQAVPSTQKQFIESPEMTHNMPHPAGYLVQLKGFLESLE